MVARTTGAVAILLLSLSASAQDAREGIEFFEKKIRPVLVERCYTCHSGRARKSKGGLLLDTAEGVLSGGVSGPAIVPGDPDQSRLIQAIRYGDDKLRMPPKRRLAPGQVKDFERWVRIGAPDPRTNSGSSQAGVYGISVAKARSFWSFRPPEDPPVPKPRQAEWARTPLDRFILAKLEGQGMSPSPMADKRTLIRRATYDLIGLPPTAEEIEAFEADPSPDAFERVVERLLDSPHYGERWGRHWLDVARYADTKGYSFREERRFFHSHVYRDWVIRAFNEDLPYDQFLIRQIAADQLVPSGVEGLDLGPDRESLAAMGFITLGRRFTKVIYEIIDDRIDVLMRGTMGLTATCARCHDHKFDPITMKDYYSLYGMFAGSMEKIVRLEEAKGAAAFEREYRRRKEKLERTFRSRRESLLKRLRDQVADYLAAVLTVDELPSDQFFQMLGPEAIHPVVVRRWEAYLFRTRREHHPVFAPWHALAAVPERELAVGASDLLKNLEGLPLNAKVVESFTARPPSSMHEVARRYGRILLDVHRRWQTAQKDGGARPTALPDPADEELRQVLYGPESPLQVPEGSMFDVERYFDDKTRNVLCGLQTELEQFLVQSENAPAHAVILTDRPVQEPQRVFRRGNPSNLGEEVERRFLEALSGRDAKPFRNGSGRLELARAIASRDNPLTARVMVNRIWLHHFGAGLVRTPSDFGFRGEPPSHPLLLDYLALRFIEGGWSIKNLHRLIMRSSVYRQSSADRSEVRLRDPSNRNLWRMNRRRLDFESMRDSLLAASGRLDRTIGGRGVDLSLRPSPVRRTLYGYIHRLELPTMYRTFDFASPDSHSPRRYTTTIPQQALFLMNSPFVVEQARHLAGRPELRRMENEEASIRNLYRLVYGRSPTSEEIAMGKDFLGAAPAGSATDQPSAWTYGVGEVDEPTGRLRSFHPFGYFTGQDWQADPFPRDPDAAEPRLDAGGGRPGSGRVGAVVRRWTSPRAGTVTIRGRFEHKAKKGDGVHGRIVHGEQGEIASWTVHKVKVETNIEGVEVKEGDTVDFIVEARDDARNDAFTWSPEIRMTRPSKGEKGRMAWNASAGFAGPPLPPQTPWARYAQVLLLANEFIFVD